MSKFVLTAQLRLQAPTNTQQVINDLRRQLEGVNVPVKVEGAARAKKQLDDVGKSAKRASTAAEAMGRSFGLAFKRFAAFTVASRAVSLFTSGLANAVDEAIQFQREMIKISQVTGKTIQSLRSLEQTITRLSVTMGVSSKELLNTTRVLSQAGLKADDLKIALATLAKTTLAPTFENITKTAEGAIAILAQFKEGVGALERQLGAINAVAGQFAVESGDLIGAIRRTGGVFVEAGGKLEEFLGLFTSIRATTRESSESIATGLRTIFTRIQRPKTIEFLRQYGVELQNLDGSFVGPFEAVRRLNKALSGLGKGDITFIKIAEQLGGFRQIGKVIPLLKEFELAERARQAAIAGGESLEADKVKAQAALSVQIIKVKEEFLALVRSIADTTSFQAMVKTALGLASALIKVADAIKPLIPLIAAFAAFKLAKGIGSFAAGFGGTFGRHQGGRIHAFARGGMVPGQGNRDTVPAMLQPGEFVMRKSSVNKMGAGRLAAMNDNKFAAGGLVVKTLDDDPKTGFAGLFARPKGPDSSGKLIALPPKKGEEGGNVLATLGAPKSYFIGGVDEDTFTKKAKAKLSEAINELAEGLSSEKTAKKVDDNILTAIGSDDIAGKIFEGVTRTVIGDFRKGKGSQQTFDIPRQKKGKGGAQLKELGNLFNAGTVMPDIDYDNKLTENRGHRLSLLKKAVAEKMFKKDISIAKFAGAGQNLNTSQLLSQQGTVPNQNLARTRITELTQAQAKVKRVVKDAETAEVIIKRLGLDRRKLQKYVDRRAVSTRRASGGAISGSDTVPALLTPGEFVLNKGASRSIGYGNLGRMNKSGIAGFAAGGKVTSGRHAYGDTPPPGGFGGGAGAFAAITVGFSLVSSTLNKLGTSADGTKNVFGRVTDVLSKFAVIATAIVAALKAMGVAVNLTTAKMFFQAGPGGAGALLNKSFMKVGKAFDVGSVRLLGGLKADRASKRHDRRSGTRSKELHGSGAFKTGEFLNRSRKHFEPGGRLSKGIVGKLGRKAFGGVSSLAGGAGAAGLAGAGTTAAAALAPVAALAGPVLAVGLAFKILNDVTKALIDVEGQKKDAIKVGNEAEAGRLAAMQNFTGFFVGGFQQAGAELAHSVADLAGSFSDFAFGTEELGETLQFGITRTIEVLTGDFNGSLRKIAVAQAAAAEASLNYADRTRKASRALEDVKSGRKSASKAFEDISKNLVVQGERREKARIAEEAAGEKTVGFFSVLLRNTAAVVTAIPAAAGVPGVGSGVEFAGTRNERIDKARELSKKSIEKFQQEFDKNRAGFVALGKEIILSRNNFEDTGKGLKEFKARLKNAGIIGEGGFATDEQKKALFEDFRRQREAIDKNIKFIEALNFGLRNVGATADAMAVSLDSIARAGEAGFNRFADSAAVLAASVTAAGGEITDAQMDTAISDLEDSLRTFGADEKQVTGATGTLRGLRDAQKNVPAALKAAKEQLKTTQEVDPQSIKDAIGKELFKGIARPAREKLEAALDKLVIDENVRSDILANNLEGILKGTLDPIAEAASEKVLAQIKKRADIENKLIDAIKKRQAQELEFIAAQRKAIDTQLEAAKLFESFGGAKLTSGQQLGARRAQANLSLGNAGIGGLRGGGAVDIRGALSDISNKFIRQSERVNAGVRARATGARDAQGRPIRAGFEGVGGLDRDKRKELKAANEAIITFTKQRIKLIQEELKIAEQKNKAEKDALDKLLGGDIEGFLERELAAAAGVALRTGDAALASSFGAGALGAGFQTLGGQGLSDQAMERAARLSLSSVGITDPRSARVLAGTTAEVQGKKAEGRELARILGDSAQQQADFEKMDITAAEVIINAQKLSFRNLGGDPSTLAGGGMVYASRGMFVSRGTDTIPAMLTPGEFVVNRASVNRGNNLSMLRAMNGGGGARGMSSGGSVSYYTNGGGAGGNKDGLAGAVGAISNVVGANIIDPLKKMFDSDSSLLGKIFGDFSRSVKKLLDFQLSVKVDPTNVTVNFNGANFLAGMREGIRDELLERVREELKGMKFNDAGDVVQKSGNLGG